MSRDATWNTERIDALRRYFTAGLSCSQIAREIGVTRNAVIGKMNRLGLTRPKEVLVRAVRERAPRPPSSMRQLWRREPRATVTAQQRVLGEAYAEPPPRPEEIPIRDGRGCSLLELGRAECRWPVSAPGSDDFCYCGNEPVKGLPYCVGHARLAYRQASDRRRSA
jgi:GcrA cell cycle regulator